MNYAQARRAVVAKFGDHGLVEHARREKKEVQYRVFLKTSGRPVCIGAGSSWKRAVEMAMKAEVTRTPSMPSRAALDAEVAAVQVAAVEPEAVLLKAALNPCSAAVGPRGDVTMPTPEEAAVRRFTPLPGAALDAALAEAKAPAESEDEKPWVMHAMAAVKTMSLNPIFTSDDVWELLDGWGLKRPTDSRALGQVMQRLKREGVIKPTGETVPTRQKSRNHAPIAVWVGTPGK